MTDPFTNFKAAQREGWASFAPLANFTTVPAARVVGIAGITAGQDVLDVGCGTGVVALTAARTGARVRGLDLTPALLEHARENARVAGVEIDFVEGDAEALPYADASFDVVVSQFGHMFAPRAEVSLSEMLRVLKPGGTIAFATWPPDHFVGRMFRLIGSFLPAPPEGATPPPAWGDPEFVTRTFGDRVEDILFDRDVMIIPALSPQHYRASVIASAGPATKVVAMLQDQPEKLATFTTAIENLVSHYLTDNVVRQSYLLTRARKRR